MVFAQKCWFRGRSKFFEVWNFRKLNITRLTSHKMVLSKNIWSLGTLNYQKYQKGATRGHVRCYTVVHVTILVNFEFFADGRDMVVVSTNTGISSICFLHDPTDFGSKLQGGPTLKYVVFYIKSYICTFEVPMLRYSMVLFLPFYLSKSIPKLYKTVVEYFLQYSDKRW